MVWILSISLPGQGRFRSRLSVELHLSRMSLHFREVGSPDGTPSTAKRKSLLQLSDEVIDFGLSIVSCSYET